MKLLITAATLMVISGSAFADELDYVDTSFQSHEHFSATQPAVGSADIDYVHLSFQDSKEFSSRTARQPEVGGVEIDYLNQSFQDSY